LLVIPHPICYVWSEKRIEKKKEEKTTQAAKSPSHPLRKRGHLGRLAPSPEKKRGSDTILHVPRKATEV